MNDQPQRARLRSYLNGNNHPALEGAAENWDQSALLLSWSARTIQAGATKVADGDGSADGLGGETAQAILEAFQASARSMNEKSAKLTDAATALHQTADVIHRAETAESQMADLQQPTAYTAPTRAPGVQPTPLELSQEAARREQANQAMASYQSARREQETAAAEWTAKLDETFLTAIAPMKAIHGEPDPTEPPPPSPPRGPSGPGLPASAPPGQPTVPSGPGRDRDEGRFVGRDPDRNSTVNPINPVNPVNPVVHHWVPPTPVCPPPHVEPIVHPINPVEPGGGGTTTVTGTTQSGVTQAPGAAAPVSGAPTGSASAASGAGAGAAAAGVGGAALGAGAIKAGVPGGQVRPVSTGAVKPIGSTTRAGAPASLSRSATPANGATGARGAGSPVRAAGAAAGRAAAGRGGAAGSTAGAGSRGGAGARGAAGSRSASGAKGQPGAAGQSAARGGAAGRGGRRGDENERQDRDALVYDQDWLGDDDAAPHVLD